MPVTMTGIQHDYPVVCPSHVDNDRTEAVLYQLHVSHCPVTFKTDRPVSKVGVTAQKDNVTYIEALKRTSFSADILATIHRLHSCNTSTESSRRAQHTSVVCYEIEICICIYEKKLQ